MRGEYDSPGCIRIIPIGSPPLARGIPRVRCLLGPVIGITPACAGNTTGSLRASRRSRDHPRLRGEYQVADWRRNNSQGSPPLARGILRCTPLQARRLGITPACAGNTLKKSLIYNLFPISIFKFHLVSQTPEML